MVEPDLVVVLTWSPTRAAGLVALAQPRAIPGPSKYA